MRTCRARNWEIGLISKEQAQAISEVVLKSSRSTHPARESILRRSRNPGALLLIVPLISLLPALSHYFRHLAEIPIWVYVLIGLAFLYIVFAVLISIYQRSTPLLKIERDVLISYGAAPWKKKEFALTDITAVTFHLKLHSPFWRPAYMIFLQLENAEHRILIPNALPSPALPTRRMLAANFKDKYSELAL
jgi:hypothetical protein